MASGLVESDAASTGLDGAATGSAAGKLVATSGEAIMASCGSRLGSSIHVLLSFIIILLKIYW
jgi:hypothetical protein